MDSLTLDITPLFVNASDKSEVKIYNGGPGTLYYKTTPDVSSSSYDGTIASRASLQSRAPKWIVTTTPSKVFIEHTEEIDDTYNVHGIADTTTIPSLTANESVTGKWTFGDAGDPGAYPESRVRIFTEETGTSGRLVGVHSLHYVSPASAPGATTDYHGFDLAMEANNTNVNANTRYYLFESSTAYAGTGTLGQMVPIYGYAQNTSTGTVSDAQTYRSAFSNSNASGVITSAIAYNAVAPVNSGTITAYYGLKVGDLDAVGGTVTNAWGIYVTTGKNYLGGKLGIGIASPSAPLHLGSDAGNNTSGIIFGSGIDTQLYRSGEGQLTLNGTGALAGTLSLAGYIFAGNYVAAGGGAGDDRCIFGYANGGNAAGFTFGDALDVWAMRGSATTIKSNAAYSTVKNAAPADADLSANEMAIWFDPTNGASKLMIKAKQADGTVKTGSVSLA